MKKILSLMAILVLVLFPLTLKSEAEDVSGTWDLTVSTERGDMTWEAHFEQDGENLKVTMKGQRGDATGEGTITGNTIEWTITRSTPRGEMTMTWSGEVSGETMSGEVQFGSFGTFSFEGTKRTS